MTGLRSLLVVQIGSDDSLFGDGAYSDTLRRQLWYGEMLARKRPGSRLTCLVLTKRPGIKPIYHENVAFIPVRSFRVIKSILVWIALRKLYREREIDVLSPQDLDAVGWIVPIFGKLYAVPSIAQIHYDLFSIHSIRDHMGNGLIGLIKRKVILFFLGKFSAVRVVGKTMKSMILQQGLHGSVSVIPVAVTLLQEPRELNHHDHQKQKVLFVGRLSKEKNLKFWLDVAKRVHQENPAVEFDIVGDGSQADALMGLVKKLGLETCVHFHGSVPYEQLSDYYRSASVFLLTSHYEGFGRVLVEASAYGLPPVAPRIAGVDDIILDGQTGFLCAPDDAAEIANKVLALINDPDLRISMGKAAEKYVSETFDSQKLAQAWVDLLIEKSADDMTIPPLRPTFRRWMKLSSSKYSLLRGLEYERINGLVLHGRTLDVGGGLNNSYYHLITFNGVVESANLDIKIQPSLLANLNTRLPISDAVYDNFISLNTFEHIEHDTNAIRESFRILKPGGGFHIIVPFLYNVHGSPYDYHRHTAFWWNHFLISLNVLRDNFAIEPLMWDPSSSGYAIVEFSGVFRFLQKKLVMLPAVFRSIRWKDQDRLPWLLGERQSISALGYYIYGRK